MSTAARLHKTSAKTVLCHGCFDLLHLGHIRYLEAAKKLGTRLVVSVTADIFVNKGRGRPHFSQEERCEALRALSCVDEVMPNFAPNAVDIITDIKPDIYVKGSDYENVDDVNLDAEKAAVEACGGKFYTTDTRRWSSSQLLHTTKLSDEARTYCSSARDRGFLEKIQGAFDRADKLKIAFIGETIVDEYHHVKSLGKPAKEHVLATLYHNTERFMGGVVAAARHGEWVDRRVITPRANITKTRYVNEDVTRKLFEVYSAQVLDLSPTQRHTFNTDVGDAVAWADVVILFDFGHDLITTATPLSDAKFFAVTAQTNAGNCGFNPVTKYCSADYVCVDEPEARLAAGMQHVTIDNVLFRLGQTMGAHNFVVTRGRHGAVGYANPRPAFSIPAFAEHGIDTMGAGDAFLAVTAPLIAAGLGAEEAAFVGNVAGSIKINILGHRGHVTRCELTRHIEWLLS